MKSKYLKKLVGKLKCGIKGQELERVYQELSIKDIEASKILKEGGFYNQSAYLLIQAIEKQLRAKIFSIVNAEKEFYREKNNQNLKKWNEYFNN